MGIKTMDEMSFKMKIGIMLEDGVAKLWEDETGHRIVKASAETIYYLHPQYPNILGGTPDRRIVMKDGTKGILEVKTTSATFDVDNYPDSWLIQLTFYLGLLGLKKGFITWFELKNAELKYTEIDFDSELYDKIINDIVKWHNDYVVAGIEPPAMNTSDVLSKYPIHKPGYKIEANEEVEKIYQHIIQIQNAIKPYEKEIDVLKEQVKIAMGEAEVVESHGSQLFTWKSSSMKKKFDEKAFRNDHIELYDDYCVEEPGSRRFLIKT
jgi:predicted phage-related endonuclease